MCRSLWLEYGKEELWTFHSRDLRRGGLRAQMDIEMQRHEIAHRVLGPFPYVLPDCSSGRHLFLVERT